MLSVDCVKNESIFRYYVIRIKKNSVLLFNTG